MKSIYALRSIVHLIWMALTVVPVGLWMVCAAPFTSKAFMYRSCKWFLGAAVWGARVFCGVRHQIHGFEHLPKPDASGKTPPTILLVKHQSTYETFLMPLIMPQSLAYVFKKEILKIPFFGWGIGLVDMIHIDRSQGALAFNKVAEQGQRIMGQGSWIIMFPEGTRIPRHKAGTYKTGGTRLALQTGACVVPIAVTSAQCWPRKGWIKTPGTVDVVIGQPISPEGHTPESLMALVEGFIEEEMQRRDPAPKAPA